MRTHTDVIVEYYGAFNRRDREVYARLFTKNCKLVAPAVQLEGIEAMRAFDQTWSSVFSEARIESLRMAESNGALLSCNWFHGGTHIQPLQTPAGLIAATGRSFEAPYTATFEFEGDRIETQRIVFDAAYIPAALGIPTPVAESNLDVVMRIYDAFSRGDLSALLERLDAQAELLFEGPTDIPWAGRYQGREGWTTFFQTLGQNLDEITLTMEPFAVQNDNVIVSGRYRARVRLTGERIDSPLVHLWTVRDGVVIRCVELTNTAAEAMACSNRAAVAR